MSRQSETVSNRGHCTLVGATCTSLTGPETGGPGDHLQQAIAVYEGILGNLGSFGPQVVALDPQTAPLAGLVFEPLDLLEEILAVDEETLPGEGALTLHPGGADGDHADQGRFFRECRRNPAG